MASQPVTLDPDDMDTVLGTAPTDPASSQSGVTGSLRILTEIAQSEGDFSHLLTDQQLTTIGADAVRDYEMDCGDRQEWEDQVEKALKRANQERIVLKDAPSYRFSSVNFPILTIAAQQFNARAYPAICKPGNMVKIKIIGSDKGRPKLGSDGQPMMQPIPGAAPPPVGQAPFPAPSAAPGAPVQPPMMPVWDIPPGAKQKRADRVADYMNVYLEFRMDNWEEDTDILLYQLPIIGCAFRKRWWADGKVNACYVSGIDLVVPMSARSLDTTPRTTERMPDVYPYQIAQRMASGEYRDVTLTATSEDDQAPRLLLEQHRLIDLDGDGLEEPYIVTVDKETSQVLKIEANFGPDDITVSNDGRVTKIVRKRFYIKYSFLPNPKGHFYDIGFGHLLDQMGDIINTTIDQMFDAGAAQIAGGGFFASGLRLQGNGQTNTLRWMPGEYKPVSASANDLRAGIVERTFPGVSPIMFQLLEMMLGAAKDVTSVKDVVTGDAPNTAPVGTTMALIEQGLQVFTAIYKRVYRALGMEFNELYDDLGSYGDEQMAEDYTNVLDDPQANFAKDFAEKDMDIKPVADPANVTKMQQMARAQFMLQFKGQGLNDIEIDKFAMESAGIDDIDRFLPDSNAGPPPDVQAKLELTASQIRLNDAHAASFSAGATKTAVDVGHTLGQSVGSSGMPVPQLPGLGSGSAPTPSGGPDGGAGIVTPLAA